jgi:hypothetical protein
MALKNYGWEMGLFAIIVAVIVILALVTHLSGSVSPSDHPPADATATPKHDSWQFSASRAPALSTAGADRPARRPSRPSDPNEVVLGPNTIGGRFILLASHRRQTTPTLDELTLRLRVVSLAVADLVTPFQSAMLQVRVPSEQPIYPADFVAGARGCRENDPRRTRGESGSCPARASSGVPGQRDKQQDRGTPLHVSVYPNRGAILDSVGLALENLAAIGTSAIQLIYIQSLPESAGRGSQSCAPSAFLKFRGNSLLLAVKRPLCPPGRY